MDEFIQVMKALSDPNRVKLLKMLQARKMCVCELQAALHLAQPTISKHLKLLEKAGLVTHKKDGLWVDYAIADGSRSPYVASLLGQLRHWLSNHDEVVVLMNRLPTIRREEICRQG